MGNIYDQVIIQIKVKKLNNMLESISHDREQEFLNRHMPKFVHFYDFFIKKLFPFLQEINSNIAWKVIYNGASFYVSEEYKQDGRFMSIVFQANNKLKYVFYQGPEGIEKEFNRESRPGRKKDYYWYYVNNMEFDRELARQIVDSYQRKKSYLFEDNRDEEELEKSG